MTDLSGPSAVPLAACAVAVSRPGLLALPQGARRTALPAHNHALFRSTSSVHAHYGHPIQILITTLSMVDNGEKRKLKKEEVLLQICDMQAHDNAHALISIHNIKQSVKPNMKSECRGLKGWGL